MVKRVEPPDGMLIGVVNDGIFTPCWLKKLTMESTWAAPVFMTTKVVEYPPPYATCGKYSVVPPLLERVPGSTGSAERTPSFTVSAVAARVLAGEPDGASIMTVPLKPLVNPWVKISLTNFAVCPRALSRTFWA